MKQRFHLRLYLGICQPVYSRASNEYHLPASYAAKQFCCSRSHPALYEIAPRCFAYLIGYDKSYALSFAAKYDIRERAFVELRSVRSDIRKTAPQSQSERFGKHQPLPSGLGVRFFLPLSRRRLSTLRPAVVFILALKPCTLRCVLFLGW